MAVQKIGNALPCIEIKGAYGDVSIKVGGVELTGVRSLTLDMTIQSAPVLTLEFIASGIDVETDALVEALQDKEQP